MFSRNDAESPLLILHTLLGLTGCSMSVLIHLLGCAFGLGSWVVVNGLWVELPLIVKTLPEGWDLPSYLTVIIQLANLGPLVVTLTHKLCPGRLKEHYVIFPVLSIGVVSCVLLGFFWDRTTVVAGAPRSTAFLTITFFLSMLDCTSSVTFLPFMNQFPAEYVSTYFIGEGLSGFIPGVVALAQGVGLSKCVNTSVPAGNSTNETTWVMQTEYLPPNFSTEVFFFILAAMVCISLAAFTMLYRLPRSYELSTDNLMTEASTSSSSSLDNPAAEFDEDDVSKAEEKSQDEVVALGRPEHTVYQLTFIYCLVVWINSLTNGLLPSVQTFSCIPYGNLAYHLSAALSSVANPMACTVVMFFPNR